MNNLKTKWTNFRDVFKGRTGILRMLWKTLRKSGENDGEMWQAGSSDATENGRLVAH